MSAWLDNTPTLRTASALERLLTPYENVRNFGAVGDGVADDTAAFILCREAIKESAVIDSGEYRFRKHMWVPNGIYKVTTAAALMDGSGLNSGVHYLGHRVIGQGRETAKIVFTPGSAGALCSNPDLFEHTTFEHISFYGGNSNAVFLSSLSQGNAAQNYTFRQCSWDGTWNEGIQLTGNASANNNSEVLFEKCAVGGGYAGAFFHSGLQGFQAQDQFVNFDFNACELAPASGNLIQLDHGGSCRVRGGSLIMAGAGTLFDLNNGSHSEGATQLRVEGQRIELRTAAASKLVDCDWKFGNVTFQDCTLMVSAPTWTIARFYGSADSGPLVVWDNCRMAGQQEYQYDANSYLAPAGRAIYRNCVITQYDDMQDSVISTALASTTAIGGAWAVEFQGCTGKDNYGANGANRAYDVAVNWQTRQNAEVTRRSRALKNPLGVLPQSSGGYSATIEVWLPLNCVITDVNCSQVAVGADTATGWAYTLRTSEGSPTVLATISPGTQWKNGWSVHVHDIWFVANTDAKRHLVLTATSIASSSPTGLFVIDYLPGS